MKDLRDIMADKIPQWQEGIQELIRLHGDTVVSNITVSQLFRGLRGVRAVVCDSSYVDPAAGLFIRAIPVQELIGRSAEEIFFLLCTGELPGAAALKALQSDLAARAVVPEYVWSVLKALPKDTHPMVLLSTGVLAMQKTSVFSKKYNQGMNREAHWEATLEDALNLIARLPVLAGGIYQWKVLNKLDIPIASKAGLTERLCNMLGIKDPDSIFKEFIRQFFVVHSDHEGANASVLTGRIVNSTLSDLYYCLSASMNCLSGPIHGLANQESVKFVLEIQQEFKGIPKKEDLRAFIWKKLQAGSVIPGFGHAVLREQDPRFLTLLELGKRICGKSPIFRIVEMLADEVPPILKKQGKAQNPYANIDGVSGALLYHFGIRELEYYTVLFAASQALGICAQLVINRAILSPIFRPKSITSTWLQGAVGDNLELSE